MIHKNLTSVFIIPRGSSEWKGNEAGWITASGWAAAGEQLWGNAVVATSDGLFNPRESRLFPRTDENSSVQSSSNSSKKNIRKLVPEIFITAYKDWRLKNSKPAIWPIEVNDALKGKNVKMVWQRHDLFSGPGRKLADKYKVPLVTSVEALAVWEAEKWGVKRPFWGKWMENNFEAKALKESDLVCCVSSELQEKVLSLGVDPDKVIVTPNRVDSTLFNPGVEGKEIALEYNLSGKKVIGWIGSFRDFHGIDHIIEAFILIEKKYPKAVLMLIGDGNQMPDIKKLIELKKIKNKVILTGKQKFTDIPGFVSNFDIAIVSARSAAGFHYSPLKLREYKATGKAVIAPRAGEIPELFTDEEDLLLYDTGNIENLAQKMETLLTDENLKLKLEESSKNWFEKEGAWIHELKSVCDILEIKY
ncbi:glycosyltransferase family 4 protein [Salegentibacter salegens]|uniref:Glycosyltransferase involved in cell wall bisynthesis n=1 Tax=Salegentibacter salegens TaxID=143223 RepID=A0A1M7HDI5_9FLAO|nr:glycosyltransferase family 4 protein [Salegentibacter salegens]PRX43495.1 glycosyltransferase involved in cell wall biosynthesis [Salegentibacter salegens]SHM26499.1 Glycosyltransferase involved in cell wall bisynthesis [Salegentibacter salegens]